VLRHCWSGDRKNVQPIKTCHVFSKVHGRQPRKPPASPDSFGKWPLKQGVQQVCESAALNLELILYLLIYKYFIHRDKIASSCRKVGTWWHFKTTWSVLVGMSWFKCVLCECGLSFNSQWFLLACSAKLMCGYLMFIINFSVILSTLLFFILLVISIYPWGHCLGLCIGC